MAGSQTGSSFLPPHGPTPCRGIPAGRLYNNFPILVNPSDAVSWNRLLLLIPGIGPRTGQKMIAKVQQEGRESLRGFARGAQAESIRGLLEMLSQAEGADSMTGQIERVMAYYLPLMKNKYDDYPKRTKDLEHLLLIAERYRKLSRFLSDLALESRRSNSILPTRSGFSIAPATPFSRNPPDSSRRFRRRFWSRGFCRRRGKGVGLPSQTLRTFRRPLVLHLQKMKRVMNPSGK